MSNTQQRIIVAAIMAISALGIALLERLGIPAVRWAGLLIVFAMIVEYILALRRGGIEKFLPHRTSFIVFFGWLILMLFAINSVGAKPWVVLLLLLTICAADTGAWFFGRMLGGDKMWERLSSGKTWSGQIAGVLCGTFASVMYGLLGADVFMPQLMWIGMSVSLMSQYGDLTASWLKRQLGIKDFGTILPGHGGVLDRFDGWIYVLPIAWLATLG